MRRRAETADAESLAFELFQLVDPFAGENDLVIHCFHRGNQNEVVALQAGLDHCANIDDGRIAGHQRLSCHPSAAEKNPLCIQTVLAE